MVTYSFIKYSALRPLQMFQQQRKLFVYRHVTDWSHKNEMWLITFILLFYITRSLLKSPWWQIRWNSLVCYLTAIKDTKLLKPNGSNQQFQTYSEAIKLQSVVKVVTCSDKLFSVYKIEHELCELIILPFPNAGNTTFNSMIMLLEPVIGLTNGRNVCALQYNKSKLKILQL